MAVRNLWLLGGGLVACLVLCGDGYPQQPPQLPVPPLPAQAAPEPAPPTLVVPAPAPASPASRPSINCSTG